MPKQYTDEEMVNTDIGEVHEECKKHIAGKITLNMWDIYDKVNGSIFIEKEVLTNEDIVFLCEICKKHNIGFRVSKAFGNAYNVRVFIHRLA